MTQPVIPAEPCPVSAPANTTKSVSSPATPQRPPETIIDLTGDRDQHETTIYPTIKELLTELDEDTANLGFSQYEERLASAGFCRVHQVIDTPDVCKNFDQLGIPAEIGREIFERAARMTRRAEKSKQLTKTED